ncbi:chemotaxis protein CheA [Lysinibacillus capsici]|jgi:two-component system, chemotaxis family, sensor kinase CheA|uniref:Chemotaxis protein CheA n=1 Tax=Lysinibacillus capsici TaxID=2115968 RepID=A0ABY8KG14_9BACI|nr:MULTISPECIES: chemotaxis protein CheA [Lysinibacillus]KMN40987.1 chemotaxis protein CheA [Lysinibacillus sp. LK3]MDP1393057.1 chemotaxis protein CheA [Lysinibacillus capsici]MDP1413531.1 chemotaxis protein CheA [Lysinibacillus capsici]MDP1429532.1 chemotaxis protein CheA [Lysinibacillus capsici]MEC1301656.1 chemotaxis protein CheA [Lysinibacillus capsici]
MEVNQYLEMFIEESKEHLQACSEHLLELEKNPDDLAIVGEIFRSAHTLKGMSATMGFEDLADLTHKMENVLDAIRNEKIHVTPEILDVVFESVDHLEEMVMDIANGGDGKRDVSSTVAQLKRIELGEEVIPEVVATVAAPVVESVLEYDSFEQTVITQSAEQGFNAFEISVTLREDCLLKAARVFMVFEILEKDGDVIKSSPSVEKLEDEQFDQQFYVAFVTKTTAEDMQKKLMKVSEVDEVIVTTIDQRKFSEKVFEAHQEVAATATAVAEVAAIPTNTPAAKAEPVAKPAKEATPSKADKNHAPVGNKTIRVNIERLDILMNLFEELVIDRGRLQSISTEVNHGELNETVERMSRVMGDLQTIILTMRMVPVETVFNRFPKMIRQLSRDLNKKINLEIIGAETELDRTVIDEIGDPLVHLIRNSVDHGIENPTARRAKGKPEEGTVVLRAYHSGNYVFIEIEDDGAGINREKVLAKAISKGIVTQEQSYSMSDKQINELILASGFSTADVISDVSGRGVGLDVVKTTIESLGGNISIESTQDVGSIFSIQLPLTLSIISVMLVEIEKEIYAIPLSSIIETSIIRSSEIMNAHNQKVIDFRGKVVPLVFLEEIFEVPRQEHQDEEFHSVVIVRKGEKLAGLVVDSFIGQQEIVLKSLGNYLTNIFAISGATILGNGKVALIVDCNALIK